MKRELLNIKKTGRNKIDYDLNLKINVFKTLRQENVLMKDYINLLENRIIFLEGVILEKTKNKS
ncbi:TPA: hypothetical protein OT044_001002 [Citrobacter koseri]|uniref:hypothetical protein n=1 Tax=Citrobacter TaxID=544 RepID=UPI000DFD8C94|nr:MULTISPECIES: hypothetical protein [Citrobacter]MCE5350355.1 hypothetical protein [Citrobacter koseri]MDM3023827.1 hypothetical protein [Citrobacter sp. CK194]STB72765.1 Uncharacterised protein [Citrobacter koseri]STT22940.1 Uncharacterised protein [Citrobacter koseri]HCB2602113.1 hypothetical protein [Citrobacter koseri]